MRKLVYFCIVAALASSPFWYASAQVIFPNRGGTGATTTPTQGQVLLGNANGTFDVVSTSSLGIAGGLGTVTSIAVTGSNGIGITGSPITTSGTIGLSLGTLTGVTYQGNVIGAQFGGTGSSSLSGILKGNGTGVVQTALAGTDYENALTFTAPLSRSTNIISCLTAGGAQAGCLSALDYLAFGNKLGTTSIDTSAEVAAIVGDETGTGAIVFATSPTLTFANLTGTSLYGSTTLVNATATTMFATTASSTHLFATNATTSALAANVVCILGDCRTAWPLSAAGSFGTTSIDTSAELATIAGDETGSGALVFGTNATLASTTLTGNSLLQNATTTNLGIRSPSTSSGYAFYQDTADILNLQRLGGSDSGFSLLQIDAPSGNPKEATLTLKRSTTTPSTCSSFLDLYNDAYPGGTIQYGVRVQERGSCNGIMGYQPLVFDFYDGSTLTEAFRVATNSPGTSLGYVGFATATPAERLSVAGNGFFSGTNVKIMSSGTGAFDVSRVNTSSFASYILSTAGVNQWTIGLRNDSTNDFHFRDNINARSPFYIKQSNGNIGLGTSTVSSLYKLTVGGGSYLGGNVVATGTLDVIGNTTLTQATTSQIFSTVASSTSLFATNATTSALATNILCLLGDCRSTWPSGGGSDFGTTSIDLSSELAGILTDETGTGSLVFSTGSSLASTTLSNATATVMYSTTGSSTNLFATNATTSDLSVNRLRLAGESFTDLTGTDFSSALAH